jgi:hypothetical protein
MKGKGGEGGMEVEVRRGQKGRRERDGKGEEREDVKIAARVNAYLSILVLLPVTSSILAMAVITSGWVRQFSLHHEFELVRDLDNTRPVSPY